MSDQPNRPAVVNPCKCQPIRFHGKRRDSAVVTRVIHAADCPIRDQFKVRSICARCQGFGDRHAWWCLPLAA